MSANIFIVRHGQDIDNANGILNGRRSLPLTDLGRRQAIELAIAIKEAGINFHAVYCSPLDRSKETASILCDILGLKSKPVILPELIEREFGVMTGVSVGAIEECCQPDILKTDKIVYFLNPEGAETFQELMERGNLVFNQVNSYHAEGNILLVCHGDIGKMIYASATGKDWESALREFHFGNGDLIEISSGNVAHIVRLTQYNL